MILKGLSSSLCIQTSPSKVIRLVKKIRKKHFFAQIYFWTTQRIWSSKIPIFPWEYMASNSVYYLFESQIIYSFGDKLFKFSKKKLFKFCCYLAEIYQNYQHICRTNLWLNILLRSVVRHDYYMRDANGVRNLLSCIRIVLPNKICI